MTDFYITTFADMLNHRADITQFLYVHSGDDLLARLTFASPGVKAKWDAKYPILDRSDPRVVKAIVDYPAMAE
jgi:hypothetical protein